MATCRDCAHYDIEAHRLPSGKMRVTNKTALCQFDMSRLIRKFPASVAPHDRAVKPHWMAPTDGNGCPHPTHCWCDARFLANPIRST